MTLEVNKKNDDNKSAYLWNLERGLVLRYDLFIRVSPIPKGKLYHRRIIAFLGGGHVWTGTSR